MQGKRFGLARSGQVKRAITPPGSRSGEDPGWERKLALLLSGIVALPMTWLVLRLGLETWPRFAAEGDMAVIQLYTRSATRFQQLLGPYSRFGFHHPGPAMFYLLAPGYLASGGNLTGSLYTALLFNLFLLTACAWILYRLAGVCGLTTASVVLPTVALALGANYLGSIWNPNLSILPFLVAVLALVGVAAGDTGWAPVAVAASSFALQTHLALGIPLGFAWAAAAGSCLLWSRPPSPILKRRSVAAILIATAVGVALWLPVGIEQIRGNPGNVASLAEFLRGPHLSHPFVEAAKAVSTQSALPLLALLGARVGAPLPPRLEWVASSVGALQWLAMPAVLMVARRRQRSLAAILALLTCALGVAAVLAMHSVDGPLLEYLSRWTIVLGVLALAAIALTLLPARIGRLTGGGLVALAAVEAALLFKDFSTYPPYALQSERRLFRRVETTTDRLQLALRRRGITRIRVRIAKQDAWGLAAGLILGLVQGGQTVSVDQDWVHMFGPALTPGPYQAVVEVAAPGNAEPGGEVVLADPDVTVLIRAPR